MSDPSMQPESLALITGAAGGIGEAVARRFAAQGHRLVLVERTQELAERAAAEHAAAGGAPIAVCCDLTDRAAVDGLCAQIEGEWADHLEVVFLNAGVILPGDVVDSGAEALRLQLDVMLGSVMVTAGSAARAMVRHGRGHLLATVSMGGILSLPGSAAYSAAKAGLRAYLAALSAELKGTGVAVSGIYPSAVDTPMLLHEATHDGSLLNFFGKVSSADDVADVVEKAQRKKKVEHYLPYSDAILCRLLESFPWLIPPILAPAEAIGRRGRAKYLAGKGITP